MNHKISGSFSILIVLAFLISCNLFENNSGVPLNENIRVNAYLVFWQHNPEIELIHSAMFNNSLILENTTEYLPPVNEKVNEWIFAISFYGTIWEDVHLLEKWSTEDPSIYLTLPFSEISRNYNLTEFEWDEKARKAYLHLVNPRTFVSFDKWNPFPERVKHAKTNRFGGVMLWDLSSGFSPNGSLKNSLLEVIKSHINK